MIKFFRSIRLGSLEKNRVSKYILYAIGEILLVVIGILIALQINAVNQQRIDRAAETQLYRDILSNLQQDSITIKYIIDLLQGGIESQEYFISTSFSQVIKDNDPASLQEKVISTRNGVLSFFPRVEVFNSIVLNNEIRLIQSEDIKSKLLALYDYSYKRNENADIVMENHYQYDVAKFFSSKLQLIAPYDDAPVISELDPGLLERNYSEFRELIGYIYPHTHVVKTFLEGVQDAIDELIGLLKEELG